jgi:hypothetical protein
LKVEEEPIVAEDGGMKEARELFMKDSNFFLLKISFVSFNVSTTDGVNFLISATFAFTTLKSSCISKGR